MPSFPLSTLAPTIGPDGITAPPFADILTSLQTSMQQIYGQDVFLDPSTPDGQWLAILAKAQNDSNNVSIAIYQQFNPAFAQGVGLSSIVKINGITRNVPSNSQVDLTIGGDVGTVITNGIAADANGNLWALPASVTIPNTGQIIETATCTLPGTVAANPGTITLINTPTRGWQTVTNVSSASLGAPVEDDASLRIRQGQSVSLPALTVLAATTAAVEAIVGVTEVRPYENDTGSVDVNGLPPHSISLVVEGGDAVAIATAIMIKKTPGGFTYGSTTENIVDSVGVTHPISFFVPIDINIGVQVNITAKAGYVGSTGTAIIAALVAAINANGIGNNVNVWQLSTAAQFGGPADPRFATFELTGILINDGSGPLTPADVIVPFNAQAQTITADITLVVS